MERKIIGIFGKTNSGKSALFNLLIGQDIAIVSDNAGTTTDPLRKIVEIPEIGKTIIVDTGGTDDKSALGKERIAKTLEVAKEVDLALILFCDNLFGKEERDLIEIFNEQKTPVLIIHSKSDICQLQSEIAQELNESYGADVIEFSTQHDESQKAESLDMLFAFIMKGLSTNSMDPKPLFEGIITPKMSVLLVCPIDSEAPKGRLILPQVMAIRELLDNNCSVTICQLEELKDSLEKNRDISLVVTDSQVFKQVAEIVPPTLPLTSFSMLLARSKGPFDDYIKSVDAIDSLKCGDNILILENCSHHPNCEDIGRVKIPNLLKKRCGFELNFDFIAGLDKIDDIKKYSLVIQCGGCMVTKRVLHNRIRPIVSAGIPIINYGMIIALMTGVYNRAIKPLL